MLNHLKVLFDPGGGSACNIIDMLRKVIPGEIGVINGKHNPRCLSDPEKRLNNLAIQVRQMKYDVGIAFDAEDPLGCRQ